MSRLSRILLTSLALAGCGTSVAVNAEPSVLPAADAFNVIPVPADQTFASPTDVAQHFAQYNPSLREGTSNFSMVAQDAAEPSSLVMVFAVEGYLDDSVDGQQWRTVLQRDRDGWRVIEAGRRFKCYSGNNAGKWQKDLCP